jgi:hypothetical protein
VFERSGREVRKVFLVLFPCAAPSPSHYSKKELLAFLPLAFAFDVWRHYIV